MCFSYVGLIKKNSHISKVLVQSNEGRYYVWTAFHYEIGKYFPDGVDSFADLPLACLELASQRQIDIGRGNVWIPDSANTTVQVEYIGIISGGKKNKQILVKYKSDYCVCIVSIDLIKDLKVRDMIAVDRRFIHPARQDQIEAGLGLGTLRRRKRVSVS